MTVQQIYEAILESNTINFIIMTAVLVWIFKVFNLGKLIDDIEYNIRYSVTSSSEAVQNALAEYKKARKNSKTIIPSKKEVIFREAKGTISKLEEKNRLEIEKKEDELKDACEKTRGDILNRKILITVQEVQTAVLAVSSDTIKSMLTPEIQKKMILNSLDEFDKIEEGL